MLDPRLCCAEEEPSSPGSRSRAAYLERLQASTGKAQATGMSVVKAGELLAALRPLIYTLALFRSATAGLWWPCSGCTTQWLCIDSHMNSEPLHSHPGPADVAAHWTKPQSHVSTTPQEVCFTRGVLGVPFSTVAADNKMP